MKKGFKEVHSGEYPQIEDGAKVYMNKYYVAEGESRLKYFICELSKGYALIADNKRDLRNGEGHIYSIWDIDSYQVF